MLTSRTPPSPPRGYPRAGQSMPSSLTLTPLSPSEIATTATSEDDIQLAQDAEGPPQSHNSKPEDERSEGESVEPDDSADDDWSHDEEATEGEEEAGFTAESVKSASDEDEDISINLQQKVAGLIREDACERHCLEGKAREIEWLVCSLSQMNRPERMTSIYTALALLMQTDTVERRRGAGTREKFHYYLPFIGPVCRPSFARCLGVIPLTIQRYKSRVRGRNIAPKAHGNKLNKHASKVDVVWLVKWFQAFAAELGDGVPVRVRLQKTVDGKTTKYYSRENYTMLPASFTWSTIYNEMHAYVDQIRLRDREPAPAKMRKLLSLHCPTIRIRSPRSNACDLCATYQSRMCGGPTAEETEELGRHTGSARRMRSEYKADKTTVRGDVPANDTAVIVMDFSQNLTIPSVSSTPSQWYFCSLVKVNVFGIFCENDGVQTNYVYDETVSGKEQTK